MISIGAVDDGSDEESNASDVSLSDHLRSAASRVFRTPSLWPNQLAAIKRLLVDPRTDGKVLLVERTGGGKSLVMLVSAITVGGITLVIVPLLALTANQLSRIRCAVQKYGAVDAQHADEITADDIKNHLVPKIHGYDMSRR